MTNLQKIEKLNAKLNAFISVNKKFDSGLKALAVKDNIAVKGLACTAGSKILQGHVASYDATSVALAKKTGKLNAGNNGAGTTSYLAVEMLKQATGASMAPR